MQRVPGGIPIWACKDGGVVAQGGAGGSMTIERVRLLAVEMKVCW